MHFYDGNRGPLYHLADKVEVSPEEVERQKPDSWWYKKASGGGSLLDYLGYGATLGTWYMNGEAPLEVTCVVDETPGIEVDQHSITICRYATWPVEDGNPLGHLHRSLDDPAAAEMRLCLCRHRRHALPAMTTRSRHGADAASAPNRHEFPPIRCPTGERNAIEYVLGCIDTGEATCRVRWTPSSASRHNGSSTPRCARRPKNARWSLLP